jgi:hypothetical protein
MDRLKASAPSHPSRESARRGGRDAFRPGRARPTGGLRPDWRLTVEKFGADVNTTNWLAPWT